MSCPAIGVWGIHSDRYYEDGEQCAWCGGMKPTRLRWVGVTALVELVSWIGDRRTMSQRQWRRSYQRLRRHYSLRRSAYPAMIGSIYGVQVIRSSSLDGES